MPAVNPLQGEVAIPYPCDDGAVVGCLGARAWAWVAEETGSDVAVVYTDYQRKAMAVAAAMQAGEEPDMSSLVLPVAFTAAVLWAAMEHSRRKHGGPLPAYTIDDGYAVIDHIGSIEEAQERAILLINLSAPVRKQVKAADEASGGRLLNPLIAAAAGTGTPSSPQESPQASTPETSGN